MSPYPQFICSAFGQKYTIREVAKLLKCSDDHVVALYDDGELEGINIARKGAKHRELRFSGEALDAFAHRRKGQPSAATKPNCKPAKTGKSSAADDDYGSWFGE